MKNSEKSLGLFSTQSHEMNGNQLGDNIFPIVGNQITRSEIYEKLKDQLYLYLKERFKGHEAYKNLGLSTEQTVHYKLISLTKIMAYALSEKKPGGLASQTKNISSKTAPKNKKDPVFLFLKKHSDELNELKVPEELIKFYPEFTNDLSVLKKQYEDIIQKYEGIKNRNSFFSNEVILAFHDLRMNPDGLTDKEIRDLWNQALSYFKSQKYFIYNDASSIEPLMYQVIDHSELYFGDGAVIRSRRAKKQ